MRNKSILLIFLSLSLFLTACNKPWEDIKDDPEREVRRSIKESILEEESQYLKEKNSATLSAVVEDNLYKLIDNLAYAINAKDFDFLLSVQVLSGKSFKAYEPLELKEKYSEINFLKVRPIFLDKTDKKAFLELEIITNKAFDSFLEGKNKRYLYFSYNEEINSWYLERFEEKPLSQENFYGKSLSYLRQTEFVQIKDQTLGREEYHFKGLLDIPGISSRNNRGVIILNPAARSLRLELQLITDVRDGEFLGPVYYCDFDLYTKELTDERILKENRLDGQNFNNEEFRIYESYIEEISDELLNICRDKGQFEEESQEGFAVTFIIPDNEKTPWENLPEASSEKYPFAVKKYRNEETTNAD